MRPISDIELDFCEQASELEQRFGYESYCLMQESMLQKIPAQLVANLYNIAGKQDTKILSEALSNLTAITVDTEKTSDFFSRVYNSGNLENIPITTPLKDLHEVETIRPAYLEMFIDDMKHTVEDIVKGKITSKDELVLNHLGTKVMITTKKRMVRTTLPYDQDYKILIRTSSKVIPCDVTKEFLMNTCLPFLRNFKETIKSLSLTTSKLMENIQSGFQTITDYTKTYNDISGTKLTEETSNLVAFFIFNAGRAYMDLANYATFMMTRQLNNYMFNVNAYMDLYNKIMNYFPDGNSILHESVLDGSLEDIDDADTVFSLLSGDCSVFKSVVRKILDAHKSDLLVKQNNTGDVYSNSILQSKISDNDYDESPYSNLKEILGSITTSLDILEFNIKDPYIALDDIKEKSSLNMPFNERFGSQLARLNDITTYTDQIENMNSQFSEQDVLYCIINELEHFEENMDEISKGIILLYSRIKGITNTVEANVNGEFRGAVVTDGLKTLCSDVEKGFRDFILVMSQKMMLRLNELDHIAYDISADSSTGDPEIEDDTDFLQEATVSCMLDTSKMYQEMVSDKKRFYQGEKLRHVLGVNPFMEDGVEVQTTDQDKTNTDNAQQNQNNQNTNTNTQQNQTTGTNNNSNENGETKDANGNKSFNLQEMLKAFNEFFQNIINKFKGMIEKQSKQNLKWIDENEEALRSRVLRGTVVKNFYEYDTKVSARYLQEMNQVVSNINRLGNNLKTMSEDDIDKALFGFINISADKPIREKMNQWYTTGAAEMKPMDIANKKIQDQIPAMIDYCKAYYTEISDNVIKTTETIRKTWDTKAKSLKDVDSGKIIYVNKQIKYYAGAVMNCLRNRNYAYLKVLKSLAPTKKQSTNEKPEENQNTENTSENETK